MNLNLSREDLGMLYRVLTENAVNFSFVTRTEALLSFAILKPLVRRMINRQFATPNKKGIFKLHIADYEALVLRNVLATLKIEDDYYTSFFTQLYWDLDQHCQKVTIL